MKARLNGRPDRTAELVAVPRRSARTPCTILGIDPSLRGTGYGIIRTAPRNPSRWPKAPLPAPRIGNDPGAWRKSPRPSATWCNGTSRKSASWKGLFFAQNLKTAIVMGEARGAALAAVAESGLDIYEIATRKVKQAIVGYGAAQKIAVAKMVQRMLNLAGLAGPRCRRCAGARPGPGSGDSGAVRAWARPRRL